jgi:hypothetical protein
MSPVRLCALLTLVATIACSSSAPRSQEPELVERNRYFIEYNGVEVDAELSFRWAAQHLGDSWLVLKLSLKTARSDWVEVDRNAVKVRTPDGYTLSLIDQSEFRRAYGKLRVALDRTQAWQPPTPRFAGSRHAYGFWLLAPPGEFSDRSRLRLHPSEWATGPLVFQVPVGVQPGRWVLMIDLEESDVRIPFVLEHDRY